MELVRANTVNGVPVRNSVEVNSKLLSSLEKMADMNVMAHGKVPINELIDCIDREISGYMLQGRVPRHIEDLRRGLKLEDSKAIQEAMSIYHDNGYMKSNNFPNYDEDKELEKMANMIRYAFQNGISEDDIRKAIKSLDPQVQHKLLSV